MGCSGETAETARTRLIEWQQRNLCDKLYLEMLRLLRLLRRDGGLEQETVIVDSVVVRAQGGGEKSGPSPVDREKSGR